MVLGTSFLVADVGECFIEGALCVALGVWSTSLGGGVDEVCEYGLGVVAVFEAGADGSPVLC